jgi:hypothetical protein
MVPRGKKWPSTYAQIYEVTTRLNSSNPQPVLGICSAPRLFVRMPILITSIPLYPGPILSGTLSQPQILDRNIRFNQHATTCTKPVQTTEDQTSHHITGTQLYLLPVNMQHIHASAIPNSLFQYIVHSPLTLFPAKCLTSETQRCTKPHRAATTRLDLRDRS